MYCEIHEFNEIIQAMMQKGQTQSSSEIFKKQFATLRNNTDDLIQAELQNFRMQYDNVLEEWHSLEVFLQSKGQDSLVLSERVDNKLSRLKRGLINPLGKLMGFTFGVSTSSDLHPIKQAV